MQLVRVTTVGKNALDFTLAYYLGRAVLAAPTVHCHIVSRDKGYDALIEHLHSQRIQVRRHDDFNTLPFTAAARPPAAPQDDLVVKVWTHLRQHAANRPKRQQTLLHHLQTFAGKSATPTAATVLLTQLRKAGHVDIDAKGAVTYYV